MLTITAALLRAIAPQCLESIVTPSAPEFTLQLPPADIVAPLRAAHLFAQLAHETAGFATLEEYASGKAYEGREDLGNTQPGDGPRYKGRCFIMLTGRANYRSMGLGLKQNLEEDPELVLRPAIGVAVALKYWTDRGLSHFADRDDIQHITRMINGGLNGLDQRRAYLARAKHVFGIA